MQCCLCDGCIFAMVDLIGSCICNKFCCFSSFCEFFFLKLNLNCNVKNSKYILQYNNSRMSGQQHFISLSSIPIYCCAFYQSIFLETAVNFVIAIVLYYFIILYAHRFTHNTAELVQSKCVAGITLYAHTPC